MKLITKLKEGKDGFMCDKTCKNFINRQSKPYEVFLQELYEISEGDIFYEGEKADYPSSNKVKMSFFRKSCGHHFEVSRNAMDRIKGCPICQRADAPKTSRLHNYEAFLAEADAEGYDVLTNKDELLKQKGQSRVTLRHRNGSCNGYTYSVTINHFRDGKRCPYCAGCIAHTEATLKEKLREQKYTKYTYVSFEEKSKKLTVRCNDCGYMITRTANTFLHRPGCNRCNKKERVTREIAERRVLDRFNGEVILQDYTERSLPVTVYHKKCEKVSTYKRFSDLMHSSCGCSACAESGYEKAVRNILDSLGIPYESQKTFKGCTSSGGGLSRFDFVVKLKDLRYAAIEVDGEGHFMKVSNWDFNRVAIDDSLKTSFCESNNIPLLRIRYDQMENAENMIKELITYPERFLLAHSA